MLSKVDKFENTVFHIVVWTMKTENQFQIQNWLLDVKFKFQFYPSIPVHIFFFFFREQKWAVKNVFVFE